MTPAQAAQLRDRSMQWRLRATVTFADGVVQVVDARELRLAHGVAQAVTDEVPIGRIVEAPVRRRARE